MRLNATVPVQHIVNFERVAHHANQLCDWSQVRNGQLHFVFSGQKVDEECDRQAPLSALKLAVDQFEGVEAILEEN